MLFNSPLLDLLFAHSWENTFVLTAALPNMSGVFCTATATSRRAPHFLVCELGILDRSCLSAWIACNDKVHRVNSQVTAGLRRPVRTHAACISSRIALRPSLGSVRCCDPSFKITFLALGAGGQGRAEDRWKRSSELLARSRKRSTRQPITNLTTRPRRVHLGPQTC